VRFDRELESLEDRKLGGVSLEWPAGGLACIELPVLGRRTGLEVHRRRSRLAVDHTVLEVVAADLEEGILVGPVVGSRLVDPEDKVAGLVADPAKRQVSKCIAEAV